jgi:hypothetical protein
MALDDWRDELGDATSWRREFGSPDAPAVLAALSPEMTEAVAALRRVLSGQGVRVFIVGPPGVGKGTLIGALLAEAEFHGHSITTVTAATDPAVVGHVAKGEVEWLAVSRLDDLSLSVREGIVNNRHRCVAGMLATSEGLSTVMAAALTDSDDVVIHLPPIETRPRDVLAISQLLWPDVCGQPSDLLSNCDDEAAESLCRGPYPNGVHSLRATLGRLADALIASGVLLEGEFRRSVDAQDVGDALLSSFRAEQPDEAPAITAAVIVVEGETDVDYLSLAADLAERAWGWRLLDGCELQPAGAEREGGATAVWRRLFELSARSIECVGLFDNDDVGRREMQTARRLNLRADLLPSEFDRLRLPADQRSLEIEDLLCLGLIDRFYQAHADLEPEETRTRVGGLRRITPQGVDKQALADWAAHAATVGDCERMVYALCRLRKLIGLPIPRTDFDAWMSELCAADC